MLRGAQVVLVPDIPPQARQWRNMPEVWKWCRQYAPIDENHHAKWLERIAADPTIKMFGIEGDNRRPIGVCGLTSIDRVNQKAEFSLYIAPTEQAKGYGKDALKTLLQHAFFHQNLWRVWGEVYAGNPALKTFGELGFKVEGVLREDYFRNGKFIDVHRIAILRKDFKC